MKTVILNADDFGANETTNAAILRAHTEGVLTGASLMVNEPSADEAIQMARAHPSLGVGLHLALSDGLAALPAHQIPSLAGGRGRFPSSPALAGLRAFFLATARRQVRAEVAEQAARFQRTGLVCDHLDGHQHLHLHPVVWEALLPHAPELGARWVRIPFEEFRPASPGRMAGRRTEWILFRILRKRCLRSLRRAGLLCADRVYGHLETGRMTEEYVLGLVSRLEGQVSEIYFHPGTPHAVIFPGGEGIRDVELHALLSPLVRARLEEGGFRRAAYSSV